MGLDQRLRHRRVGHAPAVRHGGSLPRPRGVQAGQPRLRSPRGAGLGPARGAEPPCAHLRAAGASLRVRDAPRGSRSPRAARGRSRRQPANARYLARDRRGGGRGGVLDSLHRGTGARPTPRVDVHARGLRAPGEGRAGRSGAAELGGVAPPSDGAALTRPPTGDRRVRNADGRPRGECRRNAVRRAPWPDDRVVDGGGGGGRSCGSGGARMEPGGAQVRHRPDRCRGGVSRTRRDRGYRGLRRRSADAPRLWPRRSCW